MIDVEQLLLEQIMTKNEVRDFIKLLRKGEVFFKYIKSDGSLRRAHGTMKPGLIPSKKKMTSDQLKDKTKRIIKKRHLPEDSIFYYDLTKKAFRSFKSTRFEGIID